MRSNLLAFILMFAAISFGIRSNAQGLVNITVGTTYRTTNFQCGSDGFLTDPDPRYDLSAQYLAGGVGSGFTGPAVFVYDDETCSGYTFSHTIMNHSGVCADEVQIDFRWWDEDGCGSDTQYNTGCTNDDENYFTFTPIRALSSLTPGVNNNFTESGGNFTIDYYIYYEEVPAPTISGTSVTSVCQGSTATLIANTSQTIAGCDFYWYDNALGAGAPVGSGGTFTPVVTTATSYWVMYADAGLCGTGLTQVDVTIQSAPVPTGTGTTTCENTSATISAFEATAVDYNWYDDAVGTTLLGTGSTYTTSVLTAATSYWVSADHANGCESALVQVDVTMETESTAPTSVNLTPSTPICPSGGPVSLAVVGGSLGTGADWVWYEGGCASGTPIGTGATIAVNPAVTTDYFVRAEGNCNNTACASNTVTVLGTPTDPTSITASSTTVCLGQPAILSVNGGSPAGGDWVWYENSCGGSSVVGTGSTISVTPGVATDYYVRGENACGVSNCVSVSLTVDPGANAPTGADVTVDNICPGDTTQVYVIGTTPPAGYVWVWYTDACGAVPVGVGDTIDVMPTGTETYYVAAVGTCGATTCQSVTVTVQNGNVAPTSVSTDNNNFCAGGTANLTVVGGSLVGGATWEWYQNSCGGVSVGTGSSISVSPTTTTTYYVRGEGGACGSTACATITIMVFENEVYLVPFDTVCVSGNEAFDLTGGLPVGGAYSGTAVTSGVFDATAAGVGSHTITYTYTDGNGCTGTAAEDIVVVEANTAATDVTADNNVVCNSGSATLTVNGGNLVTGADWFWYENACGGGASIGNGTSITVSPTQTTTYFVRAEGGNDYCGPTECVAITISVSNPEANLLPFDDVCGTNVVTLEEGIPSGGTYSGTGVSGNTFDAGAAGVGVHTITYTYTDGNGCTAVATGDIVVADGSITATTSTEVETCANGGVLVHVVATGGSGNYTYNWSDGSTQNPHMWTDPGAYTVTVGDGSGCEAVVDSIEIADDIAEPCLELPNTFTPNADGTNDTWNLDFTMYSSAKLEVYSKWGVLVYQTDGVTIQWDGNDMSGNALPAGTYYYVIDIDGGSVTQNGPISIVR